MPELILMRHAAALPAALDATDFDRPLSASGRTAAAQSARRLATAGLKVERLLFSPARRTLDTAIIVARELALDSSALEAVPELYAASPLTMRKVIVRCHADAATLLVVGHNPGISEFGQELAGGLSPEQLPTAGFWRLPFNADSWQRLLRLTCPPAPRNQSTVQKQ
jgi:phosphohistidine phosphatase